MEKDQKTLKICSIIFIIAAVLNILEIIVEIISGNLGSNTLSAIATVTEIPVSTLRISLAVSVIILAIEVIIKLFLGIKGLSAVNGNSIGKAPIILVKIGIVLMLISFIEDIIHAFSGSLNIISVAITLISLVLLIFYQKSAKNLSPTT
jgi:hypothetical protein